MSAACCRHHPPHQQHDAAPAVSSFPPVSTASYGAGAENGLRVLAQDTTVGTGVPLRRAGSHERNRLRDP